MLKKEYITRLEKRYCIGYFSILLEEDTDGIK
jgi:hypothetical protein